MPRTKSGDRNDVRRNGGKRRKVSKRKRLPNNLNPVKTSISLPDDLREFFEEFAHEERKTISYTVVLYIRETLGERNR